MRKKLVDSEMKGAHAHLRAHRESRRLTQRDLGAAIGVADSTLSLWESGGRSPDLKSIRKLAHFYGIEPSDLLRPPQPIQPAEPESDPGERARELAESMDAEAASAWLLVGSVLAKRGKSSQ